MTGSELQLAPPVTAVSSRRGAAPAQVGGRERQAACHAVVATATFACSTAASSALCSPATCTGAAWTPSVPSVTEQVKATLPNGSRGMPLTLRGRARLGACQWGQRENGAQRQQGLERRHAAVLELLACERAPARSLRLKMYSDASQAPAERMLCGSHRRMVGRDSEVWKRFRGAQWRPQGYSQRERTVTWPASLLALK